MLLHAPFLLAQEQWKQEPLSSYITSGGTMLRLSMQHSFLLYILLYSSTWILDTDTQNTFLSVFLHH